MSSLSLYRAYRPQTFQDVVGQEHVVTALKQALLTRQISHAYLFCGTRGTGKTSLAKIFARALNCTQRTSDSAEPCGHCSNCEAALRGTLVDIVELDAASNNSVENVRKIIDEIAFTPTQARYKIYIIDEAHMLSTAAFNALLKTLEEPPAHAIFILATTDPQRIPPTILSRCQRYDLHALTIEQIKNRLRLVCQKEGIPAEEDALYTLALLAKGALRDALSLLDQCRVSFQRPFHREDVLHQLGFANDESLYTWAVCLVNGQAAQGLQLMNEWIQQGQEPIRLVYALLQQLRDLSLCKILTHPEQMLNYPAEQIQNLLQLAQKTSLQLLQKWIQAFSVLLSSMKLSENPRLLLELSWIGLCSETPNQLDLNSSSSGTNQDKTIPTKNEIILSKQNETDLKQPSALSEQKSDLTFSTSADEELSPQFWIQTLDQLRRTPGCIPLFLLLHPLKYAIRGRRIHLYFAKNQKEIYNKIQSEENLKKLRALLDAQEGGRSVKILCLPEEEAKLESPPESTGLQKVQKAAQALHIPLYEKKEGNQNG